MARLPETGRKWAEITPNDSANIPGGIPDAILVGAAGDTTARRLGFQARRSPHAEDMFAVPDMRAPRLRPTSCPCRRWRGLAARLAACRSAWARCKTLSTCAV